METGGSWLGGRRFLGVAIALLGIVAVAFLTSRILAGGSTSVPIVDEQALATCLTNVHPAPAWKVSHPSSDANDSAALIIEWRGRKGPGQADLVVAPNEQTAEAIVGPKPQPKLTPPHAYPETGIDHWRNVVYSRASGYTNLPKPPASVNRAVSMCERTAAVRPSDSSSGDLDHCGPQPQVPPGGYVYDLSVHGLSCAEAAAYLTRADAFGPLHRCGTDGFTCAELGSDATTHYLGNDSVQIVYGTAV
jgi:hypothetical protein